jgi:NhaP-type Na+/H+ or K+/H+ antiporter
VPELPSIGAVMIVWLSLLGIRKRVIGPKPFSLKGWTSAHVYLGLALIVVGTLDTGFQLGWIVHTLAWALMMIVTIYAAMLMLRLAWVWTSVLLSRPSPREGALPVWRIVAATTVAGSRGRWRIITRATRT